MDEASKLKHDPNGSKQTHSMEFISFFLDNSEYGVKILEVEEIRGWEVPTHLPDVPPYVLGVINLRGSIVPILDIRKKFNLSSKDYNQFTVVIILQTIDNEIKKNVGIVVDAVSEVYSFDQAEIKPTPETSGINKKYLLGMYTKENGILILLDTKKLLDDD